MKAQARWSARPNGMYGDGGDPPAGDEEGKPDEGHEADEAVVADQPG